MNGVFSCNIQTRSLSTSSRNVSPILISTQCDIWTAFTALQSATVGRCVHSIEAAAKTASSPTLVEVAPH